MKKKYFKYKNKYKNLKKSILIRDISGGHEEQQYCYGFGTKNYTKYGAYYPSKQSCVKDEAVEFKYIYDLDTNGTPILIEKIPIGWSAKIVN